MKNYTFSSIKRRADRFRASIPAAAASTFFVAAAVIGLGSSATAVGAEPVVFSPPGNFISGGHFVESDGGALFRSICQGCHMPDAKGATGAGYYPALAANRKLASAVYPAITVLGGRHGMPPFADYLSDVQVAAVVNYVRTHFDNHYTDPLAADTVKKLREAGHQP